MTTKQLATRVAAFRRELVAAGIHDGDDLREFTALYAHHLFTQEMS